MPPSLPTTYTTHAGVLLTAGQHLLTVLEESDDYMFRYVFKETLSGYAYESGYDSETLSYLRYTVGDGTLRITDTSLSLLGTETPSYTVEGDTLRLSDGDLTLTFLRVGGNLPV